MERIRGLTGRKQSYERIEPDQDSGYGASETRPLTLNDDEEEDGILARERRDVAEEPFEWAVYAVFFLMGVSMLWAWYVVQLQDTLNIRSANEEQEYVLSSWTILSETLRIERLATQQLPIC